MLVQTVIIVLQLVEHVLNLPVPADGNSSMKLYYCKPAGCAANVSVVFCDDSRPAFEGRDIVECTGPPAPFTVCQHQGHAYVSAPKGDSRCDFEGPGGHIASETCTDRDPRCILTSTSTSLPSTTSNGEQTPVKVAQGWIWFAACLIALGAGVGLMCWYKRKKTKKPIEEPSRNPDEALQLTGIQTANQSTIQADEEPDENTSPQRGHGD